mmetsp:Transcript_102817/g.299906  ORF Transcript_102817/g.299906 Transcript_102817/m.299906 type:complete len:214 (+) Transcript_102817:787-1428(+)
MAVMVTNAEDVTPPRPAPVQMVMATPIITTSVPQKRAFMPPVSWFRWQSITRAVASVASLKIICVSPRPNSAAAATNGNVGNMQHPASQGPRRRGIVSRAPNGARKAQDTTWETARTKPLAHSESAPVALLRRTLQYSRNDTEAPTNTAQRSARPKCNRSIQPVRVKGPISSATSSVLDSRQPKAASTSSAWRGCSHLELCFEDSSNFAKLGP